MNKYKIREFKCSGCSADVAMRRRSRNTNYCSLECYRKSKRPHRLSGQIFLCLFCGKEIYKPRNQLKHSHHFCSIDCANKYQGRNKSLFICKICGDTFKLSKSLADNRKYTPKYCSMTCRNQDPEWKNNACIKGNLVQQNKRGLNKLELAGRAILESLGIEFQEQVLLCNKFLVDAIISDKKIIIQWDGSYWHALPKRKQLDQSQDAYLHKCGYRVLRFSDNEVFGNKKEVIKNIQEAIKEAEYCKIAKRRIAAVESARMQEQLPL